MKLIQIKSVLKNQRKPYFDFLYYIYNIKEEMMR